MFKEIKEPISRHPYLDFSRRKQIRYSVTDIIDARGVYLPLGDQEGRLMDKRRLNERYIYFHNCNKLTKTYMLSEKIKREFINSGIPTVHSLIQSVRLGRLESSSR